MFPPVGCERDPPCSSFPLFLHLFPSLPTHRLNNRKKGVCAAEKKSKLPNQRIKRKIRPPARGFVNIFGSQSGQFSVILSTNYVVGPLPERAAGFQKQELFQGKPQRLYYTLGLASACGLVLFGREQRGATPGRACSRDETNPEARLRWLQDVYTV